MSCPNNNTLATRFWAEVDKSDGCSPLSTRELATIFQIDITTVRQIINKETWKHV